MASTSSTAHPVPAPGCAGSSHFFYPKEKCEKPLDLPRPANRTKPLHDESLRKTLRTSTWNWNVSDLVRSPLRRTLSWGKTSQISTKTPARNWIVNDLLGSHRVIVSLDKTRKTSTSSTATNNWNVGVLLRSPLQRGEGYDRRHFNQLFHQLRLANRSSQRDVHGQDLQEMEDVWHLFHHLRRKFIESQKQRDRIDDLLHGTPLYPLLRPGQGRHPVRPRPAGLFFKAEELRLGCGGSRIVAVKFISHPGPGNRLSSWGMVRSLCQGHGDGHPLLPQHGAEPSLPTSLCSSRNGLLAEVHSTTRDAKKGTLGIDSMLLMLRLWWWLWLWSLW